MKIIVYFTSRNNDLRCLSFPNFIAYLYVVLTTLQRFLIVVSILLADLSVVDSGLLLMAYPTSQFARELFSKTLYAFLNKNAMSGAFDFWEVW